MGARRDMVVAKEALIDVEAALRGHRVERTGEDLVLCSCKQWFNSMQEYDHHILAELEDNWLRRPRRRKDFTDEERQEMADTWNDAEPGKRTRAVSERFGIPPRSVSMYLTRLAQAGYHIDRAGKGSGGEGQK